MINIEQNAFDNFVASDHSYSEEQVAHLHDALENYITHEPSEPLAQHFEANPNEPLQIVRDRKIVDYLISTHGLELDQAIELWSSWEDFEHTLRETASAGA